MKRTPVQGSQRHTDTTAISLARLLARLEQIILSPVADPYLRKSRYARSRVSANVEHARLLLLKLEHDSAGIKVHSRKQAVQTDLQEKRELVKQLGQRLYELNQLDDSSDQESDLSEDEAELQPSPAPAVEEASIRTDAPGPGGSQQGAEADVPSALRSRKPQQQSGEDASTTTGMSLFPAGAKAPGVEPKTTETEVLMSHNRTEQEALTNSLYQMAQALRQQSVLFGTSLESGKDVLGRAAEGLDKNVTGMQAAGQKMGTLQRMSRGWWTGWWSGIWLYAYIVILWIAAFVLVFFMPKLRF